MTRTEAFNDPRIQLPAVFKAFPPSDQAGSNAANRSAAIYRRANAYAYWPSGRVYELFHPVLVWDFFHTFQRRSVVGHPYWSGNPADITMPQASDPSPDDVLFPDSDDGYDFNAPYSPDERSVYNLEFRRNGMLAWPRILVGWVEANGRIITHNWKPHAGVGTYDATMHTRYNNKKALYRVNRRMRQEADLKSTVESHPDVIQAAAAMDAILDLNSAQWGIPMPAERTSVSGNRFPVAWRWWAGVLAFDADRKQNTTAPTGNPAISYTNAFRLAARNFRIKVSAVMDAYDARNEVSGS